MVSRRGGRVLVEMARFEGVRRVRWRPHRFVAGFYVLFVLGCYHRGFTDWVGEANLALLGFTLCFGFGVDRELGYDQLVTSNWVEPWSYIGAKVASLSLALLVATCLVGTTVLIASSGAWREAGWYSVVFLLSGGYFLPLVLLVELGMESRLPMVGAIVLVAVAGLVVATVAGPAAVPDWLLGSLPRAHRMETLGPLAGRTAGVSLPFAFALLFVVRRKVAGPVP